MIFWTTFVVSLIIRIICHLTWVHVPHFKFYQMGQYLIYPLHMDGRLS